MATTIQVNEKAKLRLFANAELLDRFSLLLACLSMSCTSLDLLNFMALPLFFLLSIYTIIPSFYLS